MSDVQEEQKKVNFSIEGQRITRDGEVVGLFVSAEDAALFSGLVENLQKQANAMAAIGDSLADAADGELPQVSAWNALRGRG